MSSRTLAVRHDVTWVAVVPATRPPLALVRTPHALLGRVVEAVVKVVHVEVTWQAGEGHASVVNVGVRVTCRVFLASQTAGLRCEIVARYSIYQ